MTTEPTELSQEEFNEQIEDMVRAGEVDREDVFFLIPEYTGDLI